MQLSLPNIKWIIKPFSEVAGIIEECKELKLLEYPEKHDGFATKMNRKYYIFYNDRLGYTERNKFIAHEIGHIACAVILLSLNHSVVEAGSPGNLATLTYEAFEDTLVYVTPSGQKFHKEGCRYVDKDTATEMTIEKALDKGYGAYKTCHPLDDRMYIY